MAASPTVAEPEPPKAVPQPTEPAVSAKPDEPIEARPIPVEPAVVPDEAEAPAKAAAKPQKKNAKKKEQPFLTF